MDKSWNPERNGLRFVLAQLVYSDFAGSGYRWARNGRGRVRRFWTRKSAQRAADTLNAQLAKEQTP